MWLWCVGDDEYDRATTTTILGVWDGNTTTDAEPYRRVLPFGDTTRAGPHLPHREDTADHNHNHNSNTNTSNDTAVGWSAAAIY